MNNPELIRLLVAGFLILITCYKSIGDDHPFLWVGVGYGGRRIVSVDGKHWKISDQWEESGGDDSNNLLDVVFAQNKFVAVGGGGWRGQKQAGHILVSTDGKKWRHTHQAKGRVCPIAYGKDRFVVGAGNRQLMWSKDAENWYTGATMPHPRATHFRKAAYGNGYFLILGNSGGQKGPYWCAVTENGKWLYSFKRNLPLIRDLAFGKGKFVIVGDNGVRMSSSKGVQWTPSNSNATENFNWVVFTGDRFLAGGKKAYESPDGHSWKQASTSVPGQIHWSDGKLHVSSVWPGRMFFSTDLAQWNAANPLGPNGINRIVNGKIISKHNSIEN